MIDIRLLLADPDRSFLKMLAGYLEQHGYWVACAATIDEARDQMENGWFHLVVLNIQMHDPSDLRDTSGFEILRDPAFQSIPKFVLANHPTVSMIREVLRPGSTGGPLAIDFLGKDTDIPSIIQALKDAINKHIRVNRDLKIRQKDVSILQLAQWMNPDLSYALLTERAEELESLVRSVFLDARQVTFGRLFIQRCGYAIVEFITHSDEIQTLILVCSQAGEKSADCSVPKSVDRLEWLITRSTAHFTLQIYRIASTPPLKNFLEVYGSSTSQEIPTVVHAVRDDVFALWHVYQRVSESSERFEQSVKERLEINMDRIEQSIAAICRAASRNALAQVDNDKKSMSFTIDSQVIILPNPANLIGWKSPVFPSSTFVCGLTHGQVSRPAILFDADRHCWLIDRSRVGVGPIVLDDTAFEMIIRLECLSGMNLARRIVFEQILADVDPVNPVPEDLSKPVLFVREIRQQKTTDSPAYMLGLFYTTLVYLTDFREDFDYTPDELIVFTHVLFLSAMLYGRLTRQERLPRQAMDRLWIDKDSKDVWVEGNRIELTPQELEILIYLYENAGQQRSRQQIIEAAMNGEPDANMKTIHAGRFDKAVNIEESRLNSAMSRLRLKIEPDPETPKYLYTIRGFGYRLDV